MEKKISFSFLIVVIIVFDFSLHLVEMSFTYTKKACVDHSMFTTDCDISVEYSIWYDDNLDPIAKSKYKIINQDYMLTFSSVGFTHRTLDELNTFKRRCRDETKTSRVLVNYFTNYHVAIKASPDWSILNGSMTYMRDFSLHEFWISLIDFKGFDIESPIVFFNGISIELRARFDLYPRGRLVKDCNDYLITFNTTKGFIFDSSLTSLIFSHSASKLPVCSLCFLFARIQIIRFDYMINSYYLKSMVTFTDPFFLIDPSQNDDNHNIDLDSQVGSLMIHYVYGLDLDSRFLNPHIFSSIKILEIQGHLNSIANGVFKSFRNLENIFFSASTLLKIIRQQGIEWIKSINSHVNVNLSNITRVDPGSKEWVLIFINIDRNVLWTKNNFNLILNQDFCLFVDFPFHQLILIMPFNQDTYFSDPIREYSCTELWLYRFYNKSKVNFDLQDQMYKRLNFLNFTACDFPKRIDLCRKTHFQVNSTDSTHNKVTSFDVVTCFELVFIIVSPIISAFGIVTNIMTIVVIFHKNNKETMREKHYLFLSAYCISNLILFLTQIMTLMSECQFPFGFYCSSIHRIVFIQYIKVIFGDYLNSTFRLFSNFAYFGFSVCRLTKIGKDHGKVIVAINDSKMKTYIVVSLVISAGLAVCKLLQNKISYFHSFDESLVYPLPIFQFQINWMKNKNYIALFVVNFLFNTINYFFFVCVHLFVDVVLIKKLVAVLREKEAKMREMKKSAKEMDEILKESEESKRRAVFMVVLNSTLNFFTRAPLMVTFLNDLRVLILNRFKHTLSDYQLNTLDGFNTSFNLKLFCSSMKACLMFQSFGNCLFLLSLSTILFFLKHFDKNFKKAYEKCFADHKMIKKTT